VRRRIAEDGVVAVGIAALLLLTRTNPDSVIGVVAHPCS
jgi:hypothetical protein